MKAHRHHFYEILVFQKGAAQHDIDFHTFDAMPEQLHFVSSDNVHLLIRDKDSAGFSIVFTPDYFAQEVITQLPFLSSQPFLQLTSSEFERVQTLLALIKNELNTFNNLSDALQHALANSLMLLLVKISAERLTVAPNTQTEHLQLLKKLIAAHYKQHFSVEKYADMVSVSPKHLIDLCKKQTGKTPLKLIQAQVISEAKRFLYHTTMTVKEIGYELNFDSPASFSKYFKSVTGYSPIIYRQEVQGKKTATISE
jgi:AraC family transcriptional regulator, transcriptional activator of pobA